MPNWWEGLNGFQQTMFVIAATATIIMVIFLILMFVGINGADVFNGADLDLDGVVDAFNDEPLSSLGGLKIFTLRGLLAFLSVGGWIAYILSDSMKPIFAGLIGFVAGSIAAFLLALAFKSLMKLETEGNLNYNNAIGKNGVVYIKVPKKRSGKGKITLTAQDRFLEVDAITDEEDDIKAGVNVQVIGLEDESTLLVKRH